METKAKARVAGWYLGTLLVVGLVLLLGCSSVAGGGEIVSEPAAGAPNTPSPLPPAPPNFHDGGQGRLEVLASSTENEPLSGVVLELCPLLEESKETCLVEISGGEGLAFFNEIPAGAYRLHGSLDGWADTVIKPLRFETEDPIPPLRVWLVFNPVCFDCG